MGGMPYPDQCSSILAGVLDDAIVEKLNASEFAGLVDDSSLQDLAANATGYFKISTNNSNGENKMDYARNRREKKSWGTRLALFPIWLRPGRAICDRGPLRRGAHTRTTDRSPSGKAGRSASVCPGLPRTDRSPSGKAGPSASVCV